MSEKVRLDVSLPVAQHDALQALALETGFRPGALARLAVAQFLERRDLLLTGAPPSIGTDLERFVAELRASGEAMTPAADQVAEALRAVDAEGDGNPDAVCLLAAVAAICREHGSIETRLRLLSRLIEHDGVISMPRALLNPNRHSLGG